MTKCQLLNKLKHVFSTSELHEVEMLFEKYEKRISQLENEVQDAKLDSFIAWQKIDQQRF